MASVAELKKSFFAEIDKVENREDLEKLRVKYLGREKGILTTVLWEHGTGQILMHGSAGLKSSTLASATASSVLT